MRIYKKLCINKVIMIVSISAFLAIPTLLACIALVLWFVKDSRRCSKFPPGPFRYPLVGCLPKILTTSPFPALAFQELSKRYGDVVYLRMGLVEAVTFTSLEAVHEVLNSDHALSKSRTMHGIVKERSWNRNLGLIFTSGDSDWDNLRRFTIRSLREFGFGKGSSMGSVIKQELQKFLKHLTTNHLDASSIPKGILKTEDMFDLTIVNIVWRLVTGIDYELGDERILHLLRLSSGIVKSTNFACDPIIAYPFLYDMFPNWSGKTEHKNYLTQLRDYARNTIDTHRASERYKVDPQCYVDLFLEKIDQGSESIYNDDQLVLCLLDLFMAGTESTSRNLTFFLLYMVTYPHVQREIQMELDREIKSGRDGDDLIVVMYNMRSKLPYTYATMLECIRFCSVIPFPPPRVAEEDFYVKGYLIKKGMILLPCIHSVHWSEELWGDPRVFRPERFLKENGTEIDTKMESCLVTFGGGKRICPAIALAEITMFMYFATLLKNFRFENADDDGNAPSLEPRIPPGMSYTPQPFNVRITPRF